jgi:hypothetical protein
MRFFIFLSVLWLAPLAMMAEEEAVNNQAEREEWELPAQVDPRLRIGKIYDFLLDEKYTPTGNDPVLKQEYRYFYYGAVTEAQRTARRGHYYIVAFHNDGEAADVTVRMDFRQLSSRDKVNTLEAVFKNFKGDGKQRFVIAGELYQAYGDINSWRIALVKDGKIVAEKKSFVW